MPAFFLEIKYLLDCSPPSRASAERLCLSVCFLRLFARLISRASGALCVPPLAALMCRFALQLNEFHMGLQAAASAKGAAQTGTQTRARERAPKVQRSFPADLENAIPFESGIQLSQNTPSPPVCLPGCCVF